MEKLDSVYVVLYTDISRQSNPILIGDVAFRNKEDAVNFIHEWTQHRAVYAEKWDDYFHGDDIYFIDELKLK